MTRTIRLWLCLAAGAAVITLSPARPDAATPFVLSAGEHICIIGNQLAERMQYRAGSTRCCTHAFRATTWSSATSGSRATKWRPTCGRRTSARPTSG